MRDCFSFFPSGKYRNDEYIVDYLDLIEPFIPPPTHTHTQTYPTEYGLLENLVLMLIFSKYNESEANGTATSHWKWISSSREVMNIIYSITLYANLTTTFVIKSIIT